MIVFRLDAKTGQPAYRQLIQQVKHALRLGILKVGDQLPTVKEAVGQLTINPNTVLKAYRELELEGLVQSRPGLGTFVVDSPPGIAPSTQAALRRSLRQWLADARSAGLDDDSIQALMADCFHNSAEEGAA